MLSIKLLRARGLNGWPFMMLIPQIVTYVYGDTVKKQRYRTKMPPAQCDIDEYKYRHQETQRVEYRIAWHLEIAIEKE
jgi:hypothetical protein